MHLTRCSLEKARFSEEHIAFIFKVEYKPSKKSAEADGKLHSACRMRLLGTGFIVTTM
jgi:hypothetical protein